MALWRYQQNLKPQPAVESKQLIEMAKLGELQPDDLVQQEGTSIWSPARNVKGLFKKEPVRKWVKPPKHVWERRAIDLAEKEDLEGTVKLLNQVLQKQPDHAQANAMRGILFVAEGDIDRGKHLIAKAREIDPDNATAFSGKAVIALHVDGDFENAVRNCTESLRRHATPDKEVLMLRGYAYRGLGNMAKALEDANESLSIDPNYADGMIAKLLILQQSGDNSGCIELGKKLLTLKPDDENVLTILATACFALKKYKNCEALATRFIKRYPDSQTMYGIRALARNFQGNQDQAYSDISVAVAFGEKKDYLYALLASLAFQRGNYQECVEAATHAINLDYEEDFIYVVRGNGLLNQENLVSAEADYDAALRKDPSNSYALLGKALVYFYEIYESRTQHDAEANLNQASRYLKAASSHAEDQSSINQLAFAIQNKWNSLQQPQAVATGGQVDGIVDSSSSFKNFAMDVLKDITVQCVSKLIFPF